MSDVVGELLLQPASTLRTFYECLQLDRQHSHLLNNGRSTLVLFGFSAAQITYLSGKSVRTFRTKFILTGYAGLWKRIAIFEMISMMVPWPTSHW